MNFESFFLKMEVFNVYFVFYIKISFRLYKNINKISFKFCGNIIRKIDEKKF